MSREKSIILIHIHSPRPLSFFFIAFLLRGKTSPECRAGIWTRDCHTACASALPTEPRCTLTVPRCTLLSHAAPYWATLQPAEPRCTLLSHAAPLLCHAAPYWATLHPTEPRCTLPSQAAPYWVKLYPTEHRCTLLSHAAPYWATLYPTEPRCTITVPRCTLRFGLSVALKIWGEIFGSLTEVSDSLKVNSVAL